MITAPRNHECPMPFFTALLFPKSPAAGYHADMPTTAQPVGVLLRQDALGPIPGVTDDPVLSLLLSGGTAATLHEAEEKYPRMLRWRRCSAWPAAT